MALLACGGSQPGPVSRALPWEELLGGTRRENQVLVLRLEEHPSIKFEERRRAFEELVDKGTEYGVVAITCVLVDEPKSGDWDLSPIPEPVSGLALPMPTGVWGGKGPPGIRFGFFSPVEAFLDGDGRPYAGLASARWSDSELRAQVAEAREVLRLRDAAFAEAAKATGKDRAAGLLRGLQAIETWYVVRCYSAELIELVASEAPEAVDYARPLLREHDVLKACEALRKASKDLDTIDPRRLRRQLDEVVGRFPDLPEVAVLAHCVQGTADLRLAMDKADRDRIVKRVRAATRAIEVELPWVRQVADLWSFSTAAWQPR